MTHPELLGVLAAAGHGAKILLADGNYPHSVWVGPRAERIALNLAPGLLTVDDVLEVLKKTVPIESAAIMVPGPGADMPTHIPAHDGYRASLPGIPFDEVPRFDFYAWRRPTTCSASSPRVTRGCTRTCCSPSESASRPSRPVPERRGPSSRWAPASYTALS
jgi:L-fucose mutarotase